MKLSRLLIVGLSALMIMGCRRDGCTDQSAINYDKKAKNDDGSCIYGDPNDPNNPDNPDNPNVTLPVHLSGTENSDITIVDLSSNPNVVDYYIDGTWKIDAKVTIQPGVRVEMRPGARIVVQANGSLNATGTASNTIDFFGAQDVPGHWYSFEFNSNNPNNQLIYCNISNGSNYYGSEPGMVLVADNCQATIQNSNFSKGSEFGLMTKGPNAKLPNFHSNHFSSFGKAPIRFSSLGHADYLDNSTTFSNNSISTIYIYGNNVNTSTFVPNMSIPYSIRSSIKFVDEHTKVEGGVTMIMAANVRMVVEANASLEFAGTSMSNTCDLIGEASAPGYWYNITYHSTNPANVISYSNFSDGSNYYGSDPGLIRVHGNSIVNMNNTHLSNSSTTAVDGPGTFNDNGGNSHAGCQGGGGLLP